MLTTTIRPIKPEVGLYSSGIFLILGAHVCTMFFHHVCLQINWRIKHDEFMGNAVRLSARVMSSIEVFSLYRYSETGVKFLGQKTHQSRVIREAVRNQRTFLICAFRDVLLVEEPIPFANETFFVPFPHMRVQFIVSEETLPTKFAKWMYITFEACL
jgi:hypothetical protein